MLEFNLLIVVKTFLKICRIWVWVFFSPTVIIEWGVFVKQQWLLLKSPAKWSTNTFRTEYRLSPSTADFLCALFSRVEDFRCPEFGPLEQQRPKVQAFHLNGSSLRLLAHVQQQWWLRALGPRCVESSKVVQSPKTETLHSVKHFGFTVRVHYSSTLEVQKRVRVSQSVCTSTGNSSERCSAPRMGSLCVV